MSLREALTLSPYQKWTRYRQLPTKVILHLLVALLSASLQIIQGEAMESTMQFTKRDLEHLIYPADCVSQWRGLPQYSAQVQLRAHAVFNNDPHPGGSERWEKSPRKGGCNRTLEKSN